MPVNASDPGWLPPDWPEEWRGCLSDAALQQTSSAAIFRRACGYIEQVEVLGEDPLPEPALRARVFGTETYRTEVWVEADAITGECSCPHAEDGWFCKHQVALALVWRERLATGVSAAVARAADPDAPRTATERAASLYDFLHAQDSATLADKLLELADCHAVLASELRRWHQLSVAQHDPGVLEQTILDLLTPPEHYLDPGEAVDYVEQARSALPLLQQLYAEDSAEAIALCIEGLQLGWQTYNNSADDEYEIGSWCEMLGEELAEMLQAAGPQPAAFGDTYLALVLADGYGSVSQDECEAAIGPAALARFRQALAERWHGSRTDRQFWKIDALYLAQLEKSGQIDAVLAVLRERRQDATGCGRLVSFLERQQRHAEALAECEAACRRFPNDWGLERALLTGLERAERHVDVLVLRRRWFDQRPSLTEYNAVLDAARLVGRDVAALRTELLQQLQARELGDVSLRASILCTERLWEQACALVQPPALCQTEILRNIGEHLPPEQFEAAVALLLRVFGHAMEHTDSSYKEPLALVRLIIDRLPPARGAAWLAELRVQYKAKRNFMRDLPSRPQ
ncbi:MAG: hypothetical protein RLY71_4128 [Pseudomonadota bacterium]|jgi:hypothetical protein